MTNYRRMNWSPLQPEPEYPKPVGSPTILWPYCEDLDQGIYLAWEYTEPDADTLTGYVVRIAFYEAPTTVLVEKFVSEPDTDLIIQGLVNDRDYVATVAAVNRGGEGPKSPDFTFTPTAPVIRPPGLSTLTAGDGKATATWIWSTVLPEGFVYDWMSFEAVNEVGSTVTEHVTGGEWPNESGILPLTNDHDWTVALVAVATDTKSGKQYVSDLSNSKTVHPEKPLPPYKPRLTGAQMAANNNGQIDVAFAPGIQNVSAGRHRRTWYGRKRWTSGEKGPMDVSAWQVRVTSAADSSTTSYDITDGAARTYTTPKVALGTWLVDVRAKNTVGWSDWSNQLSVTYTPTDLRPFTADKSFGTWSSATYNYAIFDPGNDPSKGWETVWTCTLTSAGQNLTYDVLVIGAGGGGKGQTATLGKGGNGGGGQMITDQFTGSSAAGFTVVVSIGGSTAIDPKNSTVTVAGKSYTATSGKSASSGADATGSPKGAVSPSWLDCSLAFGWLVPDSQYVGGVAEAGKQGYPNGLGWGQGGAGTKNSSGGKGVEGLVIIRWPK